MIPIITHHRPLRQAEWMRRVDALADALLSEQPALALADAFRPLAVRNIEPGASLHVDDLSAIALADSQPAFAYMQERARLRAEEGDVVATCTLADEVIERYYADRLGLGQPLWLHPAPRPTRLAAASACWADAETRRQLVRLVRSRRLRYLHPHMGSLKVWTLACLLSRAAGRALRVIAPGPGLCAAANDKNWFADVVARLFGHVHVPRSAHAHNFATLAVLVRQFARTTRRIVVKVPDSAGGAGNLILNSDEFRARPVGDIRGALRERLAPYGWEGRGALLVSCWETAVLSTPSSQLWIPPADDGEPQVEGLFEQRVEKGGALVGGQAAVLPGQRAQEFVEKSWLFGTLLQRLGYVGRCSLDAIFVGTDYEHCRLQLIECNARWGGTSAPMTLMNRLFGDWTRRPYATRRTDDARLCQLDAARLLRVLEPELFDGHSGSGRLIPYDLAAATEAGRIDTIAIGSSRKEALQTGNALAAIIAAAAGRARVSARP